MTLDPLLRGFVENEIDDFIKNPDKYIKLAKESHILNKNPIDFVLGVLYGQILSTIAVYYSMNKRKQEEINVQDISDLLNRRNVEIVDRIQRELEKK
jgi:hypothetical protein